MNILVCIKQVPGSNQVHVDEKTGVLKREASDSKMNPYDLYALETALKLKEVCRAEVSVLTMGPSSSEQVIRESYSMGVDKGFLISDRAFGGADVLATSYTLSQGIRKAVPDFDLIICGKQTTDGDTAQVNSELAEFLKIPSVCNVINIIELQEKAVIVEVDFTDKIVTEKLQTPCLLSVSESICQPRLPSYIMKMKTRDKEITHYSLHDMEDREKEHYGLNGSPTQVKEIFAPIHDVSQEIWTGNGLMLGDRLFHKLSALKFIEKGE